MIDLHRTRRDAPMTHWSTYSRWHDPRINTEALATYLDTTTDWIEHCSAEGKPHVNRPVFDAHLDQTRGGSLDDIFDRPVATYTDLAAARHIMAHIGQ